MVMGSYSLVILKCVAQGMPSSTFFCDSGDMITMRKANSGFFTGVVNSEWPVTARPTALFVVPPPCLPTHQDASLLSVITTVTDPPVIVQPLIWSGQVLPSVPNCLHCKIPLADPSENESRPDSC